jgi:predicted metalloprotease with PDZ domain
LLVQHKIKEMKNILSAFLIILSLSVFSQNNEYQFHLDLNKISSDLLQITLDVPEIASDKIIYNIPKIVPGTYQIYDFGQYVIEFEAFDKEGKSMSVNQLDKNRWEIDNAKTLGKVSYWVEDTWDADVKSLVFEPGGTNIEKGDNIVLNNHGFFGYFDGMKNLKYVLNITRPEDFYGSTGLTTGITKGNVDRFTTANYMDLVDAPIMYNKPDTVVINVGNADVLISVYSKNKAATAKELAKDISKILEAQKEYLGGKLPIEKYAFIIYLYAGQSGSGGSGALEHSYSSFYYLPEMPAEQLSGFVVDVSAHEFFHIVTPLNIHSEEIGNFDYINPKMSKHLWMYEGVTEYFAGHVQVYEGLISKQDYLDVIQEKLRGASRFKDELPFTEMSLGCLDEHKDEYGNVYQKGALIGLCLDILLREESNGKVGMKDMMASLSKEYGKYKSFKDEELFDKITALSSPSIRGFFTKYIEGKEALPLEELLGKAGITFKRNHKVKEVSLGGVAMGFNRESSRLYVIDTGSMDDFGKDLGYKVNDEIVSLNGVELTMANVQSEMEKFKKETKNGDKIELVVSRKTKGVVKNKKLKAKASTVEKTRKYFVEFNQEATQDQLDLQKAWLGQ